MVRLGGVALVIFAAVWTGCRSVSVNGEMEAKTFRADTDVRDVVLADEFNELSRAEGQEGRGVRMFLSILDGPAFEERPEWAKGAGVSEDYDHTFEGGVASFKVGDKDRCMKWAKEFGRGIDGNEYPWVDMTYRAEGLAEEGSEYTVWLFDGRVGHAAGFEAIVPRDLRADGEEHVLSVALARFNPVGPIIGAAVKVQSGGEGGARLVITQLGFRREEEKKAEAPEPVSLLTGGAFESAPDWVVGPVSSDYSAYTGEGYVEYRVNDADKEMKWVRVLEKPVYAGAYPYLELRYRAKGLYDDRGTYVVWMADYRRVHGGGFEAILPGQIVSDGRTHTMVVDLGRFNPAGPIKKVAIRVRSGGEGGARFTVERLQFSAARGEAGE